MTTMLVTNASWDLSSDKLNQTTWCVNFRFTLYGAVTSVLCLLGFVGNSLSVAILRRDNSTPAASLLLQSLAVADNAFLLFWFIHYCLRELLGPFSQRIVYVWVRYATFPLLYSAQLLTIWMTVLVALNRYAAVCRPYAASHLCNVANVSTKIALTAAFSLAFNVVKFFEMRVTRRPHGTARLQRTSFGMNDTYKLVYLDVLYYVMTFFFPLVILVFVNSRVTVMYHSARRRRLRMTSRRQTSENNITLVMILVVAVFIVCQAPARLLQMVMGYRYRDCRSLHFVLVHLSNVLEVLNSSVNFLIYVTFRQRFRQIFWSKIRPLRIRRTATTEDLSMQQVDASTTIAAVQTDFTTDKPDWLQSLGLTSSGSMKLPRDGKSTPPTCHVTSTSASAINVIVGERPSAAAGGPGPSANVERTNASEPDTNPLCNGHAAHFRK